MPLLEWVQGQRSNAIIRKEFLSGLERKEGFRG